MSELRARINALLRTEFAQEAAEGFPTLKRIPSTQVIRFLDYLIGLATAEQEALLDALAHFNSANFYPALAGAEVLERQQHPGFGRLQQEMAFRGFGGGYRYTPMKLLAGIAKDTAIGGIDGWIKQMGFTGSALQPREGLLPSLNCLKPVPPVKLRKLIDIAFTRLLSPQRTKIASDHTRYTGIYDGIALKVDVLFASRPLSPKQLEYRLIIKPAADFTWSYASYEGLWSIPGNWDYLTEENAPRSVDLLAELVAYLVGLASRVHGLMKA